MLMVLDHLEHVPGLIPSNLAMVFHVMTRCVGVWFAYGVVEGVFYSHNIQKYLCRLYMAAGIMFVGNLVLGILFSAKGITVSNNIFFTLAAGASMLASLKYISNKWLKYLAAIAAFLFGCLLGEGGNTILPFMLITYFTYHRHKLRNICYFVLAFGLFALSYVPYDTLADTISMLAFNSDFMFILVIPFLYLYNGERGPRTQFSKNFFYFFYPAHLWILAIIAYTVS